MGSWKVDWIFTTTKNDDGELDYKFYTTYLYDSKTFRGKSFHIERLLNIFLLEAVGLILKTKFFTYYRPLLDFRVA
jgi:hypothetical protein